MNKAVVLILIGLGLGATQNVSVPEFKIVNGALANNADFPYVVYLEENQKFMCGGAMVSPRYVATAGHCVIGSKAASLTVVGGATFLKQGGFRRKVIRIIFPNGWNYSKMHRDMAILKLRAPMPSTVTTLPLCSAQIRIGAQMKIAGWGKMVNGGNAMSSRLRTITRPVVRQAVCKNAYNSNPQILNSMFCVSNDNGQDTCQGDSGSAAVSNGELCGIVSWGDGCAKKGYPGVYTNVFNLRQFVQNAMKM